MTLYEGFLGVVIEDCIAFSTSNEPVAIIPGHHLKSVPFFDGHTVMGSPAGFQADAARGQLGHNGEERTA